jgi:hypothetical protein
LCFFIFHFFHFTGQEQSDQAFDIDHFRFVMSMSELPLFFSGCGVRNSLSMPIGLPLELLLLLLLLNKSCAKTTKNLWTCYIGRHEQIVSTQHVFQNQNFRCALHGIPPIVQSERIAIGGPSQSIFPSLMSHPLNAIAFCSIITADILLQTQLNSKADE